MQFYQAIAKFKFKLVSNNFRYLKNNWTDTVKQVDFVGSLISKIIAEGPNMQYAKLNLQQNRKRYINNNGKFLIWAN